MDLSTDYLVYQYVRRWYTLYLFRHKKLVCRTEREDVAMEVMRKVVELDGRAYIEIRWVEEIQMAEDW